MKIRINQEQIECRDEDKISYILNTQGIKYENIAIAIDGEIIPKNNWDDFKLYEGCEILIIKAAQGG